MNAIATGLRTVAKGLVQIAEGLEAEDQPKDHPEFANGGEQIIFYQAKVLHALAKAGGMVPKDEFYKMGQAAGYKNQGLAGFSTGGSMKLVALKGDDRVLTKKGRDHLKIAQKKWPEHFPK